MGRSHRAEGVENHQEAKIINFKRKEVTYEIFLYISCGR